MPELADALREYMESLVEPLTTDEIRLRPPTRDRRPRWLAVAAAAAAAVVTLVGVGVAVTRDDHRKVPKVQTVDTPTPPWQLVGEQDGRLVVIDPASGAVVRALTERQPGGGDGAPSPTGDGRFVWF